jgi:hypothetical protein
MNQITTLLLHHVKTSATCEYQWKWIITWILDDLKVYRLTVNVWKPRGQWAFPGPSLLIIKVHFINKVYLFHTLILSTPFSPCIPLFWKVKTTFRFTNEIVALSDWTLQSHSHTCMHTSLKSLETYQGQVPSHHPQVGRKVLIRVWCKVINLHP